MSAGSNHDLTGLLQSMPRRLTTSEAANYLGVSLRTLEDWRKKDIGPKWVRRGVRGVRYLQSDLDTEIQSWNTSGN